MIVLHDGKKCCCNPGLVKVFFRHDELRVDTTEFRTYRGPSPNRVTSYARARLSFLIAAIDWRRQDITTVPKSKSPAPWFHQFEIHPNAKTAVLASPTRFWDFMVIIRCSSCSSIAAMSTFFASSSAHFLLNPTALDFHHVISNWHQNLFSRKLEGMTTL